jgi:DNA polymerase-3 subunit delta
MKQVHLILGDEYLSEKRAQELIAELLPPDARAFGLEQVDGLTNDSGQAADAISSSLASALTLCLLGGPKATWLRRAVFLDSADCMRTELLRVACDRLLDRLRKGLPPSHTLIITATGMDKRTAFFKAISAVAQVEELKMPDTGGQAGRSAEDAVEAALSEAGIMADRDVVRSLAARTGNDMRTILTETEKLAAYAGQEKKLTDAEIAVLVPMSRELPAWDLADAFGRCDLRQALVVLRQLLFQRTSPIQLVLGLIGRIRELTVLRDAMDRGWLRLSGYEHRKRVEWGKVPESIEEVFSAGLVRDPRKVHPYRQLVLCLQADNYSRQQLEKCRQVAVSSYGRLLSSSSGQARQGLELELMLLRMMPRQKRP